MAVPQTETKTIKLVAPLNTQERAIETLHTSETRYQRLFEASRDGLLILDGITLKITDANPFMTELLGYSHDDFVGKELWEIGLFSDKAASQMAFRELQENGYIRYEDLPLQTTTGTLRQVEFISNAYEESGRQVIQCNIRDLTEAKRLEIERRATEDRYRTLFEYAPDSLIIADPQGYYVDANANTGHLFGYERSEMIGLNALDMVVESEPGQLAQALVLINSKVAYRQEWQLRRKDGEVFAGDVIATLMPDGNIIAMVRDMTTRKCAEETLRDSVRSQAESLALIDTILASAPFGFAFHNRDLVYERINDTLAAINGLPAERHLGLTLRDTVPKIAEILEPILLKVIETGEPVVDFELSGETTVDTEGPKHFLASFYPVRTPTGEILGVGVLVFEVTGRKRAEATLRRQQTELRVLIDLMPAMIWFKDTENNILRINKRAADAAGRSIAEIEGRSAVEVYPQEAASFYADDVEVMNSRLPKLGTLEMLHDKNGDEIWVQTDKVPVRSDDGEVSGIVVMAQDITERRHLEEQLRQSQKMEAVGVLAGGIAHDFNNLLTAISGYSDLTLIKMPPEDPLRHNLDEIKAAGERAAALTGQLLAFSRKQVLKPRVHNLNSVITDLERMLRRIIKENIEFRSVLAPSLGNIKADPGQIEQIIMNLAINARDAMPDGGTLTIETKNVYLDDAYVSQNLTIQPGDFVKMTISDTGEGMDVGTQRRIFEPFFTTKEIGKGTGMGLSIVYGIVKQSGGDIMVYSELGHGTTFKIYLPCVNEIVEMRKWLGDKEKSYAGTETVLLVEDEEIVRNLVSQILTGNGYNVLEAASGKAALALCESYTKPIHLLLTDVIMPKMGGSELKDQVTKLRPDVKVLFMSGYTDDSIANRGIFDSDAEFIEKPFTPVGLARKIREVFGY